MNEIDLGILIIRVAFGASLAYHGVNKIISKGGLSGTAGWFASLGMKSPALQAKLAATTEIAAGLLFAVGLVTPLAAGAMLALMVVAIVTVHAKVGYFIFLPNGGWEYCAAIAIVAVGIASTGAGSVSLDNALDLDFGRSGMAIAIGLGLASAAAQLALFYRPASVKKSVTE
ncbi:MAG: DoxX family protein [Ilumatobacteraceae bacterium]|nr:DoxX family protein [Ilumatobacteraceae bacterium]